MKIRSFILLKSFVLYCYQHPEERFWQALRNWSDYNFILSADGIDFTNHEIKYTDIKDTFYIE